MNVDKCIKEGLLKKTKPSSDMAKRSIEKADSYIGKAFSNLELGNYDIAVICAYTSMFHAARALLFRDGFKERSHLCVISYIEENYPELRDYAKEVDHYRQSRHTALYDLDSFQTSAEAEVSIESAKAFKDKVTGLIEKG